MASEPTSPRRLRCPASTEAFHFSQVCPYSLQLPIVFRNPAEIVRGIRTLENFGFRTKLTEIDPSKLQLYRSKCRLNMGFHVTDLWSQRQQLEFLKAMKLQRAQFARERQVHFVNFLVESGKNLEKAISLEDIQSEIEKEMQKQDLTKYRSRERRLTHAKLSGNLSPRPLPSPQSGKDRRGSRYVSPPLRPKRLLCLEDFIGHCNSTLKDFREADSKLPESLPSSPRHIHIPEEVVQDSAISLKITGRHRFANPHRR